MPFATADICDEYKDKVQVLEERMISYGGLDSFCGEIVTVKLDDENSGLVSLLRDTKGDGRVVVVDVNKNYYAVVGDNLMKFALDNGWAGIVINGFVRDIKITQTIAVGLFAIGTCPRKSFKNANSQLGIDIEFGGVVFREGEYIYADEDGVIVSTINMY